MKKTNKRTRKPIIHQKVVVGRYFKDGEMPDYKKWEVLSNFISERGKIMPRMQTGLDARIQRRLTREIKRARHLALLPFMVRPL